MSQRDRHVGTKEFMGLAEDMTPVNMPPSYFQVDQGGNHEIEGAWRLRRGMEDTGFEYKSSQVLNAAGFETDNGDNAYLIVAGNSIYDGALAVGQGQGYGSDGYGDNAYGD